MAGGDFRKLVKPGDELDIQALAWNRHQRAADWVEAQENTTCAPRPGGMPEGLIRVKNKSGEARRRYDILGIDSIAIAPHDNLSDVGQRPALTGIRPTIAAHLGKFVVLYQPLKDNGIGWAFCFGYCLARVSITSLTDKAADVKDGDYAQLATNGSGIAQILYIDPKDVDGATSSTGTHHCLVRIAGAGGGSLSRGQYQGMFYGDQTDNQSGFSYVFLVNPL